MSELPHEHSRSFSEATIGRLAAHELQERTYILPSFFLNQPRRNQFIVKPHTFYPEAHALVRSHIVCISAPYAQPLNLEWLVTVQPCVVDFLEVNITHDLLLLHHFTSLLMLLLLLQELDESHLILRLFQRRVVHDDVVLVFTAAAVFDFLELLFVFPHFVPDKLVDTSFFERHDRV